MHTPHILQLHKTSGGVNLAGVRDRGYLLSSFEQGTAWALLGGTLNKDVKDLSQ